MNDNLELSLISTLKDSDLTELGAEVTDTALDAAGSLPIVGCLHKLWKTAKSVPTYFFMKKIYRFLFELKDVPPELRRQQIAKMEVLTDERESVGETVLLLLDKLNSMNKATMMGRAFKAYLEGHITNEDLQSLNYAIEQLNCANIPCLVDVYDCWSVRKGLQIEIINERQHNHYGHTRLQHLAICGLLDIYFDELDESPLPGMYKNMFRKTVQDRRHISINWANGISRATGGYRTNLIGRMFMEIVLGKSLNKEDSKQNTPT